MSVEVHEGNFLLAVDIDNGAVGGVGYRVIAADGGLVVVLEHGQARRVLGRERAQLGAVDHLIVATAGVDQGELACRLEREQSVYARVPIVALTARVMAGDRRACLEAGMDDFLTKPIEAAQLADVLDRYVVEDDDAGSG